MGRHKGGMKARYTAVSDTAPARRRDSFKRSFTEAGGTIVGSVRFPVMNPDFAPFLQRVLDEKPDALYAFIPGGSQPPARQGLPRARPRQGRHPPDAEREAIDEADLQKSGRSRGGHHQRQAIHGSLQLAGEQGLRRRVEEGLWRRQGPDLFAAGAYDGMALVYDVVKKLNGKFDGDAAMGVIKG